MVRWLVTFDHLLFLCLHDWVVHAAGQAIVNRGLHFAKHVLMPLPALLAHTVDCVSVYLRDRSIHL